MFGSSPQKGGIKSSFRLDGNESQRKNTMKEKKNSKCC
jgi:hypothetical protein